MSQPTVTVPVVPDDFEEAKVQRETAGLTAEEVAEFRQLRKERKERDEAEQKAAEEAAAALQAPTHVVHLANGDVVEGSNIASHYDIDGALVPVAGAYVKS
jgi:hypothetical protein